MSDKFFNENGIPTVTPQDTETSNDYKLIDVRRDDEYTGELGHAPGAILKTLGPDLTSFLDETDKNTKIIFICRSGGRSGQATSIAKSMGFTDVANMKGGMILWNETGLKTE
jgi:hydroxyacylglutathione hydrolase